MPFLRLFRKTKRKILNWIAPNIPLSVYRRWMPRNPIGFFYHTVSDEAPPHVDHLYATKSVAGFEQDILYLKQHFTLVGYPELLAYFRGEKSLPPHTAFISFDDGFAECYTIVRPILLKHRVPCIFFLATNWIDNQAMYYRGKISLCIDRYIQLDNIEQNAALEKMSRIGYPKKEGGDQVFSISDLRSLQQWDEAFLDRVCHVLGVHVLEYLQNHKPFLTRAQIIEMQTEGFAFGAHTCSHPKLGLISQERQTSEIIESCRIVSEITGQDQVPFAFPFSGSGVDQDFLADLRTHYSQIGLIFDTQKLLETRPLIFNRIWVDKPVKDVPPNKNIAYWLHDAYVREATRG
jgi:peptidoglycan/xylan/chitin deacetylase (PgdA/CDA1 family)